MVVEYYNLNPAAQGFLFLVHIDFYFAFYYNKNVYIGGGVMPEYDRYRQKMVVRKKKAIKGIKIFAAIGVAGCVLGALTSLIPSAALADILGRITGIISAATMMQTGYHAANAVKEHRSIKRYDKETAEDRARENYLQAEFERQAVLDNEKQDSLIEMDKQEEAVLNAEEQKQTDKEQPSQPDKVSEPVREDGGPSQDDGGRNL